MKYTTLRLLKPQQPYRIVRVRMDNRVAILHLKEAENKEEFVSNVPRFNTKVSGGCVDEQRRVSRFKIKILWLTDVGRRTPIIRISGKRFVRYLV